MSVYGVSGSGTYAVTLSGLDELMSALPNNTVNQIRAQDARNVVYTLWESLGGGGGGSFSYTHDPVSEASTIAVGGIGVGTTFSNVPLQTLFDSMFYPAVGTVYSISTSPAALEYNNPDNTTTVSVSITKKTPTINSITVVGPGGSLGPPPTIPTTFNQVSSKPFPGVIVTQNTNTTYTLTVIDSAKTSTPQASVSWYFPRWYGSIDLNALISPNLDTKTLTSTQKTLIINKLKNNPVSGDQDWSPVWNDSTLTSFSAGSGQLSSVSVTPKNTTLGSHIVLIWPSTDYNGDGDPTDYTFGVVSGRPFVDLGVHSVENQYGYILPCRIWIRDFKSPGATSFTINN